jgi:hypothetical protein
VNHRLDYLRKVLSHKVIDCHDAFRLFDTNIDTMSTSRGLSVRLGGLGMTRLLGPERIRHALVALLRVCTVTTSPLLPNLSSSTRASIGAGADLKNEISYRLWRQSTTDYDRDFLTSHGTRTSLKHSIV